MDTSRGPQSSLHASPSGMRSLAGCLAALWLVRWTSVCFYCNYYPHADIPFPPQHCGSESVLCVLRRRRRRRCGGSSFFLVGLRDIDRDDHRVYRMYVSTCICIYVCMYVPFVNAPCTRTNTNTINIPTRACVYACEQPGALCPRTRVPMSRDASDEYKLTLFTLHTYSHVHMEMNTHKHKHMCILVRVYLCVCVCGVRTHAMPIE